MAFVTNNPVANYFRTTYEELVKVAWPTRQDATKHTIMVIGLSLATAVFFGLIDYILSLGLEKIIGT